MTICYRISYIYGRFMRLSLAEKENSITCNRMKIKFYTFLAITCISLSCFSQSVAKYAFVMATAEPSDEKVSTIVFPISVFVKDFDGSYDKQTELKSKICEMLEKKAIATIQPCTFITYCSLYVHDDYFTPGQDTVFTTEKAAQDDLNAYIELFRLNNKKIPIIQF